MVVVVLEVLEVVVEIAAAVAVEVAGVAAIVGLRGVWRCEMGERERTGEVPLALALVVDAVEGLPFAVALPLAVAVVVALALAVADTGTRERHQENCRRGEESVLHWQCWYWQIVCFETFGYETSLYYFYFRY